MFDIDGIVHHPNSNVARTQHVRPPTIQTRESASDRGSCEEANVFEAIQRGTSAPVMVSLVVLPRKWLQSRLINEMARDVQYG